MSEQTESMTESIVYRGLSKIVAGLSGLGTVLIFLLVILINTDIGSRFLFNAPIDGVKEIVEMTIVAIVFLQLADTVRAGKLTRSDGLYQRVVANNPKLGHWMSALFDLSGAIFITIILIGGWPLFYDAYQQGYYVGNTGMFNMPVWPARLILVIGCITTICVFLTLVFGHLKALFATGKAS